MVYIKSADGTEKKFACIKCIKGHRSSKCTHDKRELIEIKRKGRPVSQCETCRLLRKTKQVHIKCICHLKDKDIPTPDQQPHDSVTESQPATADNISAESTSPNVYNINYNDFNNILASTSCLQCNRPKLYCNCKKPALPSSINTSTTNSPDGSITPPMTTSTFTLSYPDRPPTASPTSISAGLTNNTNTPINSLPSSPMRHLTIPIHDPSDDIDSDTPIYKSVLEESSHLGTFTNKSSDELMTQIYSGFPSSSSSLPSTSSSLIMKEGVDDELVELSRET